MEYDNSQAVHRSLATDSKCTANKGSDMSPTKRSVTARVPSNSFDGGWIDDSLRKAARIKELPRIAVRDKNEVKVVRDFSWFCIPFGKRSAEQNPPNASFFPSTVMFTISVGKVKVDETFHQQLPWSPAVKLVNRCSITVWPRLPLCFVLSAKESLLKSC